MTLHVPRLPFALDPLIAEAKRRARQRRLLLAALVLVAVAGAAALVFGSSSGGPSPGGLSALQGGEANAGRPASTAELREMTQVFGYPLVRGGVLGAAWVSRTNPDIGLVLAYPGHWLSAVQPGSYPMHRGEATTISPKQLPEAAEPIAAYLIRLPSPRPQRRAAVVLLAQTLLRGPNVLKSELANYCAVGKRVAPALTAPTCVPAG